MKKTLEQIIQEVVEEIKNDEEQGPLRALVVSIAQNYEGRLISVAEDAGDEAQAKLNVREKIFDIFDRANRVNTGNPEAPPEKGRGGNFWKKPHISDTEM